MIARALTIAGSDPSGGAGIQADLKTFTVFRVYGMAAVTALTAQNTTGVSGVFPVSPEFVRAQIDAVVADIGAEAVKTGMLVNAAIVRAVAGAVREHRIERLVVDPVMVAGSGAALLEGEARKALGNELLPLAMLVTPNAPEAAALLGMPVANLSDMREAARRLVGAGARAALVKGGHVAGDAAVDVFYDGNEFLELRSRCVATRHAHGTGCALSAAITAGLANGQALRAAVATGKKFITAAIEQGLSLGAGSGPVNPLAWLER